LPSERESKIAKIEFGGNEIEEASVLESVTILLEDDIDISRGDTIVSVNNSPIVSQDIEALVCWMDDKKTLKPGNKYILQHGTARSRCSVRDIEYQIDINSYEKLDEVESLKLNDVARIVLRTAQPIAYDPYQQNRANGAAILIDETSNVTVGACMIE
jgi:sulfate adenylyltransferase subunit 1